ncbi:MAG TPA: hypothetical protein VFW78_04685 [Bacteroidia bacterium]|nr:hypothetical protein [Bacteroidia bacterium]
MKIRVFLFKYKSSEGAGEIVSQIETLLATLAKVRTILSEYEELPKLPKVNN